MSEKVPSVRGPLTQTEQVVRYAKEVKACLPEGYRSRMLLRFGELWAAHSGGTPPQEMADFMLENQRYYFKAVG